MHRAATQRTGSSVGLFIKVIGNVNLTGDRRKRGSAGFSLIELLVTFLVIGIIMTITVSSLLNARDKARQGATIADMRNLATAIEAYAVDYSLPPDTDFASIAELITPYHNSHVPVKDHWGHAYDYVQLSPGTYSLISYGKDGVAGLLLTPEARFDFDRDIVFTNGQFRGLP